MLRKKSIVGPFLKRFSFGLLLLAVLLAGFFWWSWSSKPASNLTPAPLQTFVVPKGEGLSSVARRLKEEGLVRSAAAFKILVLTEGLSESIQAGAFRLRPSLTLKEVAYVLTHGSLDIWLTFPEGWRREEFASRLAANLEGFDSQEFLSLTQRKEGYLFPDTYLIPQEASPSAVVKILDQNFEKRFSSTMVKEAEEKDLTSKQVLILASIVEREASHKDEDRALIAGILLKRWQQGWPLQADATVQYVLGKTDDWWPEVRQADLQVDSPFNTYKYKGLPPAPICNPGLASIKAVISPAESDYWFYLSDSSGKIHYAQTSEEHNQNVEIYLR